MGFLGRLLGTDPETKLAKARKFIDQGEFHEARWMLEGLDHSETPALMAAAMAGLVEANLEEGRARYSSGDPEGAEEHLALARSFGASAEQLRAARRLGREAMPKPKPLRTAAAEGPVGDDPIWSLPPDDPRLRYALMVETYPAPLRERLTALGQSFAAAALLTDNGQPEQAFKALLEHTNRDDVARYERARAAIAAGELPAAASELLRFSEAFGHHTIGSNHTIIMLVQTLISLGRAEEALGHVLSCLSASAESSEQVMLRSAEAQLLFVLERDEEADTKATALLRDASRDMSLVKLLSRIRQRRGLRVSAMAVLEDGLNRCCSAPGKCGSQPLDLEAVRMLAALYLEDQIEPKRVAELMRDLQKHRQQPTWHDGYLTALQARNEGQPDLTEHVQRLARALSSGDPRMGLLLKAFPEHMRPSSPA